MDAVHRTSAGACGYASGDPRGAAEALECCHDLDADGGRGVGESMRICQVANGGGFLRAEGHDECIEVVAWRVCVAGCARRVYLRCA